MIKRLWLAVCFVWTGFWILVYILGSQGLTPEETRSMLANVNFMIAIPWLGGCLLYWIVNGSR